MKYITVASSTTFTPFRRFYLYSFNTGETQNASAAPPPEFETLTGYPASMCRSLSDSGRTGTIFARGKGGIIRVFHMDGSETNSFPNPAGFNHGRTRAPGD